MIKRGREIIIEEVTFDLEPEQTEKTSLPPISKSLPGKKGPSLIQRSFVVNPVSRPDGLSLVTWWASSSKGEIQRHQCWSNLDWSVLGNGIGFQARQIRYSAMCLPGTATDEAEGENLPPPWLRPFPEIRPAFYLVPQQDARRYQPDPGALQFMRDLHHHFAAKHHELRNDRARQKLLAEAKEEARLAEKHQPKDLVIRFGLRPRSHSVKGSPTSQPKR